MENSNQTSTLTQFPSITVKKEYMDYRLSITDSFLLFFGYDTPETLNEWQEYLTNLSNKFNTKLKIVLFSSQNSDEKLVSVLKTENEKELSEIEYPRVVICHPVITEPELIAELDEFTLYKTVENYNNFYVNDFEKERDIMFEKIRKILESYPVITFIKGTPQDPFCKFSKEFQKIITELNIKYKSFNIFKDEKLRSYLRLYSGWKTYPQFYINAKVVGGLDVMKSLIEKGEFMNMVPIECKKEGCVDMIEDFTKSNKVVVFAKGMPGKGDDKTKCKSCKEVFKTLKANNIEFKVFDVLKDKMAREVVKEINKSEFYPQVVVNGKYLGGVKFMKDVQEQGKWSEYVSDI